MGLDILIETKISKKRKTCHFSRQFCQEMINQSENENSIINQIFKGYNIDIATLDKMNVWEVEKKNWDFSPQITEEEIEKRYKEAWQKSKQVLQQFQKLKNQIKSNKKVILNLEFEDAKQKEYYKEAESQIEGTWAWKNFGFDLNKLLIFLEDLPENEMVKFHYF